MDLKQGLGWVWPAISDKTSAQSGARQGFWAAVWCAGVTALVAALSLVGASLFNGIDASSFIDAILFGIIAWKLRGYSRVAAVAGLGLYLLERAYA